MDYENSLNPEQLKIVLEGQGAVLVVAGPGSGKTRTLVYRVCRLLEDGAPPESVLLLTFTNKAAREMKSRASALIGPAAGRITAGTFHHFANLLIRRHSREAGLRPNFTILDEEDSCSLLRQAVLERHESVKKGVVDDLRRAVSLSKLRMTTLESLLEGPELFHLRRHAEDISAIAEAYEKSKRALNVVDFDDLLVLAHRLLQDAGIRAACQERFRHILVDEYQDTDRLQAAIVALLHRPGADLMVVGDDSQSIYSFRGAEIRNMLDFRQRYDAKLFLLVRNYRSTLPIVTLLNSSIKNSSMKIDKDLVPVQEGGAQPLLLDFPDRVSEAVFIAERVEGELKGGKKVGVLFRAAYLASELEVELTRKGISYELRGGVRFFEQRHVKDMVSLLRAYHNPSDRTALLRLLTLFPRVGEKGVARVFGGHLPETPDDIVRGLASIDKGGPGSSLLAEIFGSGGNAAAMLDRFYTSFYRKYLEENFDDHAERGPDIDALVGAAARYPTVEEFLESFSLDGEAPAGKDSDLVLSTIHQAKGLEWDSVFIIGMADGLLPLARADDMEEERRLFYVAASRARNGLVMSYPQSSGRFYDTAFLEPSRFLLEIAECYKRGD